MDRLTVITRAALHLRAHCSADILESAPDTTLVSLTLVETLCRSYLRYPLAIRPANKEEGVLGGAWARLHLRNWAKPDRGGCIWVQRDLEPLKLAFSIAHELGHLMLHRDEGERLLCPQDGIKEVDDVAALRTPREGRVEEYNSRARRELEANAFAAELLAPTAAVRERFIADATVDVAQIMREFGVSRELAQARLVAAILGGSSLTHPDPEATESAAVAAATSTLTTTPTPAERAALAATLLAPLKTPHSNRQYDAATATGPALVVAGPGTGKTRTLIGRWAYLYGYLDVRPDQMLALTFSNRAADEMRERLVEAGLPGERAPVMTIHAFAADLLRGYASKAPHADDEEELPGDFRILDNADARLLLEELLPQLRLRRLRQLSDPTLPLDTLLETFSWARDHLLTPQDYHQFVERAPAAPEPPATQHQQSQSAKSRKAKEKRPPKPDGTLTDDERAQLREMARAYVVWDKALRARRLLDYGGLILRAVETLRAAPDALADVRNRYPHILVDEFQDTNEAAGELLRLLAGDGVGLWVVGDHNQSIYRWRGASSENIPALTEAYPRLKVYHLLRNYRSVPDIVRFGSDMAARMAALAGVSLAASGALAEALRPIPLEPDRAALPDAAIWLREDFGAPDEERAAIIADMRRRHAAGAAWGDLAALSYKTSFGQELAADLTAAGIPVTMRAEFFDRPEIKDALALLRLAANPDARGLMRAPGLLTLLGERALTPEDTRALGRAIRSLAQAGQRFPWALTAERLRASGAPTRLIQPLETLRNLAAEFFRAKNWIALRLASVLLTPGGMAWRLARIASGLDAPAQPGDLLAEPGAAPMRAADALAALGALFSLALRFDIRWRDEPTFRRQLSGEAAEEPDDDGARVAEAVDAGEAAADGPRPVAERPGAEQSAQRAEAAQAAQAAQIERAVRCFLRYLDVLERARTPVAMPTSDDDAAHILTINSSKGLEFPVVYLHALSSAGFRGPNRKPLRPPRPGFSAADSVEAERQADTRSLLYVGVTRARDALIMTRAQRYSAKQGDTPLQAALELMAESALYQSAARLPSPTDFAVVAALPDALERPMADVLEEDDGDEDTEIAIVADALAAGPGEPPDAAKPIYPYFDLERYLRCPRQYRYRAAYRLRDSADHAAGVFHRFVQTGVGELRRLRKEQPAMTAAEARARMALLWAQKREKRVAHDTTLRDYALDILATEWERIPETAETEQLTLDVALRACRIKLGAEATITRDPTRPADDPTAVTGVILERWHTGAPRDDHQKDVRLPLMLMGARLMYPHAQIGVHLVYLGASLSEVSAASGEELRAKATARQVVSVTEQAQQYVDEYARGKGKYQRLFNLDSAARRIAAGDFAPKKGDQCATCPYVGFCPGDFPE